MSRSFGARSLTTLLPILISPALTPSSPASMRSRVDFPQPDGPTSTTNSPLAISMSMPLSTSRVPKRFLNPLIVTGAIGFPDHAWSSTGQVAVADGLGAALSGQLRFSCYPKCYKSLNKSLEHVKVLFVAKCDL